MLLVKYIRLFNWRTSNPVICTLRGFSRTTVTAGFRVPPNRDRYFGGNESWFSIYGKFNKKNIVFTYRYIHIMVAGAIATGFAMHLKKRVYMQAKQEKGSTGIPQAGEFIEGLPTFTKDEVAKHKTSHNNRVWTTYRHGVYDITKYVPLHPGGKNIMWGAGRSMDDIWNKLSIHKKEHVYKLLEKYRIGNLAEGNEIDNTNQSANPVNDYKLDVCVSGAKETVGVSLNQLKSLFPEKSVKATLKCESKNRSDSEATWTGVSLDAVLKHGGIDIDKTDCKHVHFIGMDKKPDGTAFGASMPIETVRELRNDIIVAYQMNGDAIPPEHGFPVRLIVPNAYANRQVKCLNKITLSKNKL